MKFIVSTSTLLKQLSMVGGVVPSNPMVPILENLLLELKDGKLGITASDLQTSIITELPVEAQQDGSIAVPARMLTDTLKNLPEQPVTIHVDHETYSVEIISDNGRYKLAGENAADFPRAPEMGRSDSMEIPSDVLADAIGYTLFATSTDDMKPAMNGVYFNIGEQHGNFVSSDSHRLIRYRRSDITTQYEAKLIIHRKALQTLKGALPNDRLTVKLDFNPSNAIFTFGPTKLICRLIDEKFPDYENVIPLDNENKVVISRQELLSSLKRIIIYANRSTNQVRFKIAGNELRISAEDLDFSNEASERLFCEHSAEDIEIGFNAKFLIEILNNIHSDKVSIELSEPGRAGLIVPVDAGDDEHLLMLIMPIMLQSYA